ncbi:MAG: tetratricopeptide repeat protein [Hyphomicrobiaceae bacterium]
MPARVFVLVLLAGISFWPLSLRSQQSDDLTKLNAEVIRLYRSGKYAKALPLAERVIKIAEKENGPGHPSFGTALNTLALLYRAVSRYNEAESLLKRCIALREKVLGTDHPDVATSLNDLALVYQDQGRISESEPLLRRSLAIREKVLGLHHPQVARTLNNLAATYRAQGRYAAAEPLYKRAIAILEKAVGSDHPDVATAVNNLAALYVAHGRYAEAELLLKRSVTIFEKALEANHPDVAISLNNLAALYEARGRHAEAERLFERSLVLTEAALGPDHPDVAISLSNLAELFRVLGRYRQAEPLYKRSLTILEKALGPDHPSVATTVNNLALLYRAEGRVSEAEPLHARVIAILQRAVGPNHPYIGASLNNLAVLYIAQGNYAKAAPLLKRSIIVGEKVLGPDHPHLAASYDNLARIALAKSDWEVAVRYLRRATGILQRRIERGQGVAPAGVSKGEVGGNSFYFEGLVKATHRIAEATDGDSKLLAVEMFKTAQWGGGLDAASGLSQMAVRSSKGLPELGLLVRERQDLVAEWQARDRWRIAALSRPPKQRSSQGEAENAARLAAIDRRLAEIDARFARDFPDYAALAQPRPVAVRDVQAVLGEHEALILFLDTDARFKPLPEETFIWVVTKTKVRWLGSDLGTKALEEHVGALRCGLDAASWRGEGEARCRKLLGTTFSRADIAAEKSLPFDLARAHALYKGLLGGAEGLLRNPDGSWKEMIVVPSGALTQLPFQVLVTAPPKARFAETATDLAAVSWLGRRQAITLLPAVSSLKALRRDAKPSLAKRPYIGFGNPTLSGRASLATDQAMRPLAEAWQSCTNPEMRAGCKANFPRITSGRAQDVGKIREWSPLPQTACELCVVGRGLPEVSLSRDIKLGRAATERIVRQLGEIAPGAQRSALQDYRIVHFATHGMVADVKKGYPEPGLILTPPEGQPSEEDDGYLSASEITTLKLDADWVILSACNTAAGTSETTEALSGLARAFFYAGARALLVSNWEVYTNASVEITTLAVKALADGEGKVGRAAALRTAIATLLADAAKEGDAIKLHPAYWGAFSLVGEGRR